jgi:hypothetical protein
MDMSKKNTIKLNPHLHQIAYAQACSLANQANAAQKAIGTNHQVHDVLTFLVLSGLSMELYFKAIMLVARNGEVTKGHELSKLYNEFPRFLTDNLNTVYLSYQKSITLPITVIAIVQRKDKPETPDKDSLGKDFSDFENAIKSVSNIFTRARYFFEEIGEEYTYIEYPVGQINSLVNSLDKTYNSFINGEFKGAVA